MQHITFSEKSFLLGDEAAVLLIHYAALLAQHQTADAMKLNAISGDGDEVIVRLVLGSGVSLMAESTNSTQPEPENNEAVSYMRAQTEILLPAGAVRPLDPSELGSANPLNNDDY